MRKELAILSDGKPSKLGRPKRLEPDKKIMEEVLFWISSGQTLRSYCRQDGKPCFSTIYAWINKSVEFSERFARARELGSDMIADNIMETMNETPRIIEGEQSRIDPSWVALQKAKADVALKLLSKWFPSRYGDKINADVQGDIKLVINTGVPE